MSEPPYPWNTGRMLHLEGCTHFVDGMPPRLATPDELKQLDVCNRCSGSSVTRGRGSDSANGAKGAGAVETFLCESCYVTHPIAMRSHDGRCHLCVD